MKTYPALTAEQQDEFRENARSGVNVREKCGLCGRNIRTIEPSFRFCETHLSWMDAPCSFTVSCHFCEVTYGVLNPGRCTADYDAAVSA